MPRILVVEDQVTAQKMIESILQSKGHIVTCVASAIDALDYVERFPYDLIITDVMMPGGVTGFELTKTLRSNRKFDVVPIIILTSRREVKDIEKGIESGTDDYVVKPIDPDILLVKVESLLKSKQKKDQNFASVSIAENAQWLTKLQIVRISEIGLTLQSDLSAASGAKLKVKSAVFEAIGIDNPNLRVVSCEPALDTSILSFQIETHFIGMTERDLQPLRLWIRNQMMNKN